MNARQPGGRRGHRADASWSLRVPAARNGRRRVPTDQPVIEQTGQRPAALGRIGPGAVDGAAVTTTGRGPAQCQQYTSGLAVGAVVALARADGLVDAG